MRKFTILQRMSIEVKHHSNLSQQSHVNERKLVIAKQKKLWTLR